MTRHTPSRTRETIEQLLSAIESRDLRAVERYLHPDVVWQNVPHPPALGRQAVTELLANVLCWSDQVRWDILSSAVIGETGWYERVDRFWIAGEEHAVHCNGVFEVDAGAQTVRSVRDYVDLGEWRFRIEPVMTQLASRPEHARPFISAAPTRRLPTETFGTFSYMGEDYVDNVSKQLDKIMAAQTKNRTMKASVKKIVHPPFKCSGSAGASNTPSVMFRRR